MLQGWILDVLGDFNWALDCKTDILMIHSKTYESESIGRGQEAKMAAASLSSIVKTTIDAGYLLTAGMSMAWVYFCPWAGHLSPWRYSQLWVSSARFGFSPGLLKLLSRTCHDGSLENWYSTSLSLTFYCNVSFLFFYNSFKLTFHHF